MRTLKVLSIICLALLAIVGCRKKEINKLKDEINDLKTRVTVLEGLCKQNNTNINSLQTIVNTSTTQGDYITSVTPITGNGETIGYTITFANQGPITIYNGTNGDSPVIGIAKSSDGSYYWTLNGEWLLDDEGQKLHVTGGDGITPQLKVEEDNWYVSYDDGENWNFVSKAKGDEGKDGDSMFKDVTFDEEYIYFTLADGTQFKIAKNTGVVVSENNGVLKGVFSVSENKKVYFSQGNLQYCADTDIWRFAENQYDIIGSENERISNSYNGWIDLFGLGTSGYNDKYPYTWSTTDSEYWSKTIAGTNYDWGVYNKITNGGNQSGMWRTLTSEEWGYLFSRNTGQMYSQGCVNGVNGLILLPDEWETPSSVNLTIGADWTTNIITIEEWNIMQTNGAVFLPAAGSRYEKSVNGCGSIGKYWASTGRPNYENEISQLIFGGSEYMTFNTGTGGRSSGLSVRLVKDVE